VTKQRREREKGKKRKGVRKCGRESAEFEYWVTLSGCWERFFGAKAMNRASLDIQFCYVTVQAFAV
jgi:hypothetical protein